MTLGEVTGISCDKNVIPLNLVTCSVDSIACRQPGMRSMQFWIPFMLNFNFCRQTRGLEVNLFCSLGFWHRKYKVDKIWTEILCYDLAFFFFVCKSYLSFWVIIDFYGKTTFLLKMEESLFLERVEWRMMTYKGKI